MRTISSAHLINSHFGQCWRLIHQLSILSHSYSPWDRKWYIYSIQHEFFRGVLLAIKFSIPSNAYGFFASRRKALRIHPIVQSSRIVGNENSSSPGSYMNRLWGSPRNSSGFCSPPCLSSQRTRCRNPILEPESRINIPNKKHYYLGTFSHLPPFTIISKC